MEIIVLLTLIVPAAMVCISGAALIQCLCQNCSNAKKQKSSSQNTLDEQLDQQLPVAEIAV